MNVQMVIRNEYKYIIPTFMDDEGDRVDLDVKLGNSKIFTVYD